MVEHEQNMNGRKRSAAQSSISFSLEKKTEKSLSFCFLFSWIRIDPTQL